MKRGAALGALIVGVIVVPGGVVHADAAGPTDYRAEVASIEPPDDRIEAEIVGGDAFVLLDVEPGTEVVVAGYAGEPYLRFAPDGAVYENQRSPARWANQSRFGSDVPADASAEAPPEWQRVGSGGTYAWHDHRGHRMERFPPVNVERGEQVLDDVIPLTVDGEPVKIHVVAYWMPAPSIAPLVLGVIGGLAAAGVLIWRTRRGVMALLLGVSVGAAAVGWLQYASLPPETDPRFVWWLLPALATGFAAAALVLGPGLLGWGAAALAAAQLAVWGFDRREGLTRAILPTDVPFWLDRLVTAMALAVGIVALGHALIASFSVPTRPAPTRSHR